VSSSRPAQVSPFAADTARKSGPKSEVAANGGAEYPRAVGTAGGNTPVILGSTAPAAVADAKADPDPGNPVQSMPSVSSGDVRGAVLSALEAAGQPLLVSMLDSGEWHIEGSDVVVKVAASSAVIEMSVGAEAKRVATAAASGALGRPAKLKMLPGGPAIAVAPRPASAGGNRAEQDPIVRRMREKFGAEIRTIIDQRNKR